MKVKSWLKILSLITLSTVGIQQVITPVNHSTQLNANNINADNSIPNFTKVDSGLIDNLNITCRVTINNEIWVGSNTGLYVSKDKGITFTQISTIPSNATINTIMMDSADIIWAGGVQSGSTAGVVFQSTNHGVTFTKYTSAALTGVLTINSIFQDRQGKIWIGGGNSGTSSVLVSTDSGKSFAAASIDVTLAANCIFQSANGWLWIGGVSSTGSSLFVSKNAGTSFTEIAALKYLVWQVNSITQDSSGNYFVAGSYQKGTVKNFLYKSTDGITFTELTNLGSINLNIWSVFADSQYRVWIGTNAGLSVSTDSGSSFTQVPTIPSSEKINSISQDSSNVLWVGSEKGLYNDRVVPAPKTSSNLGLIIGASVGGVVLLAVIVGGLVFYRKKHLAGKPANDNNTTSLPENPV